MEKVNQYKDVFDKFEALQAIVIAQRKDFLSKFTHQQLLEYTSHQDVQRMLLDIYTKTTNSIGADKGGMKNSPRVLYSKKNVPIAILKIYSTGGKVSSESIKNELDKSPDSIDEKGRLMYTENSIKKALADFNNDTQKWLIDNKQLES
jgi:hypothetical protein